MKRSRIVNVLSYFVTIVLLVVVLRFFVKPEQFRVLLGISYSELALTIILSFGAYFWGGLEMYALRGKFHFEMEKKDILLLPLGMNLWGMLLPFQGAMAYMTVFLKRKYGVKISESFSISIFLYLLSVFLSGLIGLIFYVWYGIDSPVFAIVSALFLSSPAFAVAAHLIMERLPAPRIRLIRKVWDFGENILRGIRQLCCDHRTVAVLLAIYAARMLNMLLLYWWIVRILHYDGIGIPALLLLNLWNMLSLLIKFTPNNLGISQVISGALFAVIGLDVEQGIMISLVSTAIFSIDALSFGVLANFYSLAELGKRGR